MKGLCMTRALLVALMTAAGLFIMPQGVRAQTGYDYIDEIGATKNTATDGIDANNNVTVLTSDMLNNNYKLGTANTETWYVVDNTNTNEDNNGGADVIIDDLELAGDVHLILADGAMMTVRSLVQTSGDISANLTIYGQAGGTGSLIVSRDIGIGSYGYDSKISILGGQVSAGEEISCPGVITIYGGQVSAGGDIDAVGGISILGGQVSTGGNFTTIDSDITLGWTDSDNDYIEASNYNIMGAVKVAAGKPMKYQDENDWIYIVGGTTLFDDTTPSNGVYASLDDLNAAIGGKRLMPALSGDGTSESPYEISNYRELKAFAAIVNGGQTGACAILTADIVCKNGPDDPWYATDWTPIGNDTHKYTGTFDGDGKSITGLSNTENGAANYQGLFGYVGSGGVVKNVILESAYITGDETVGGIAGQNDGTVTGVVLSICSIAGASYVGAIAGANIGTIRDCRVESSVSILHSVSYKTNRFGGITGYNGGTIAGCLSAAAVGDANVGYVGGIVGTNSEGGTVRDCLYSGTSINGIDYKGPIHGNNENICGLLINNYYIASEGLTGDNYSSDGLFAGQGYEVTLVGDVSLYGKVTTYAVSGLTAYAAPDIEKDGQTIEQYGYALKHTVTSNNQTTTATIYSGTDQRVLLPTQRGYDLSYKVTDSSNGTVDVSRSPESGDIQYYWFSMPSMKAVTVAAERTPWTLTLFAEDATNTWATLCAQDDYALPEGCTAYVLSGVSGGTVTVSPLKDGEAVATTVPAYVPVLIHRSSTGATSAVIKASFAGAGDLSEWTHDQTAYEKQNYCGYYYVGFYTLHYSSYAVIKDGDHDYLYLLGNPGIASDPIMNAINNFSDYTDFSLYNDRLIRIEGDPGIAKNRCVVSVMNEYLVPSGSQARQLSIAIDGDDSTEISEELRVKSEEFATATDWYDLQGRKLSAKPAKKGLYIHGGRKEVIK